MKNAKIGLILVLILLCAGFTNCNLQNNVLDPWWGQDDFDYVAIIKDTPMLVYQTIIETEELKVIVQEIVPVYIYIDQPPAPEILMQYINIKDIQFVIFAGESIEYNGPPGRDAVGVWPAVSGSTPLSTQEETTNDLIVNYLVDQMVEEPEFFLILHGHANPTTGSISEAAELVFISESRAESVKEKIEDLFIGAGNLVDRITAKGYGGGRNLSGPTSSYAGLNRRVEAILFTIESAPVQPDKNK